MKRHEVYLGQVLVLDTPTTGRILVKVKKINPKNIKVVTEAGGVWNCSALFLTLPEPHEVFTPAAGSAPSSDLHMGTAVRFIDGSIAGLFVICGSHSGSWRLAKLGGNGGRYYSGIATERLEVVNLNIEGSI